MSDPHLPGGLPAVADRQNARIAQLILVAAVVVYAATNLPGFRERAGYSVGWDGWLQNGILTLATLIVAYRAYRGSENRLDWSCIAFGIGLYAVGQIVYVSYVQYEASPPAPSAADVLWLASYPFLFFGVLRLGRRPGWKPDRLLLIDALISALGLSAIAMTWLAVMLWGTQGSLAVVLTTMAYPVATCCWCSFWWAAWPSTAGTWTRCGRGSAAASPFHCRTGSLARIDHRGGRN